MHFIKTWTFKLLGGHIKQINGGLMDIHNNENEYLTVGDIVEELFYIFEGT